jgi:hypothetical protein
MFLVSLSVCTVAIQRGSRLYFPPEGAEQHRHNREGDT